MWCVHLMNVHVHGSYAHYTVSIVMVRGRVVFDSNCEISIFNLQMHNQFSKMY